MLNRLLLLACFTLLLQSLAAAYLHDLAMAFVQDPRCPPHKYVGLLYSAYKLQERPDYAKDYMIGYRWAVKHDGTLQEPKCAGAVRLGSKLTAMKFPADKDVQAAARLQQAAFAHPESRTGSK